MQSRNTPAGISGLCWFMLRRLPPLLDAFAQEIDGVRVSEDIEYIHRMRVASRRLRAALPLFEPCFSQKQYGRWMGAIAGITRALGEARDADVQIAFLQKYLKKRMAGWKKQKDKDGSEPPTAPAIRYLLSDLRNSRARHQQRVISALNAFEKSRVVPGMREAFALIAAGDRRIPRQGLAYGMPTLAASQIEARLETLLSYEPWVHHPDAVAEHHATRIAAKKLRYTMEIYGPVYRLGLAKPHARVKMIQEILGDLHDCDVWIDHITRLLLRERGRFRSENEEKRPGTATLASLKVFLLDREKERILLHRRFMRYWESLSRAGIWDELRATLTGGRRQRYVPGGPREAAEILAAVEELAARAPGVLSHERHVTRLALMLFDGTTALHGLDPRDRLLLECAGMLHDIGWKNGRRKHHIRSAQVIIAAENLPLDIEERSVIVLAAFSHRGRRSPADHPLYRLISLPYQKKVLQISALLRVADGLDYEHLGTVEEIHCITGTGTVTCDIIASTDPAVEKDHARAKADLFFRVFGRELVVR
jgi:CHAD domain-containing protein